MSSLEEEYRRQLEELKNIVKDVDDVIGFNDEERMKLDFVLSLLGDEVIIKSINLDSLIQLASLNLALKEMTSGLKNEFKFVGQDKANVKVLSEKEAVELLSQLFGQENKTQYEDDFDDTISLDSMLKTPIDYEEENKGTFNNDDFYKRKKKEDGSGNTRIRTFDYDDEDDNENDI